jgi:hypothetical protein
VGSQYAEVGQSIFLVSTCSIWAVLFQTSWQLKFADTNAAKASQILRSHLFSLKSASPRSFRALILEYVDEDCRPLASPVPLSSGGAGPSLGQWTGPLHHSCNSYPVSSDLSPIPRHHPFRWNVKVEAIHLQFLERNANALNKLYVCTY